MTAESRRLSILTGDEIEDLYGLPTFTEEERSRYFDLSPSEAEALCNVRTVSAAAHLALQMGYFKAKQQFFVCEVAIVRGDLEHLLAHHFPDRDFDELGEISKPTRLAQQRLLIFS